MDLRKIFVKDVVKTVGNPKGEKVALLLSSGMDSLSVGAACELAGMTVEAYTFQMEGDESFDSKHAVKIAETLGWKHTIVNVPKEVATIKKAFHWMRRNMDCRKKRDYECTYPMLYCYQKIAKDGHRFIAGGLVADGYFVFSRRANIEGWGGPKCTKEKFDQYREVYWKQWIEKGYKGLDRDYNPSALYQFKLLNDRYDLTLVNPFLSKEAYKFFMQFSWLELNKPRQKRHLTEAFEDYVSKVGHRNHRSYQTTAGVPVYFEQLLKEPDINTMGRKRIIDICRDWENKE